MKCKQLIALIAITAGCMLVGCHSDIDLGNIDKKAEVEMGLALPIGTIHATLGDFLGKGQVENLYVENGILTWRNSFRDTADYHKVDIARYISSKTLDMNVYDKLGDLPIFDDGKITTGSFPVPIWLEFPLELSLKGINDRDSVLAGKERMDSALIDMASFVSTITRDGGLPLDWEWIDSVTLDLGNQINRPAGNIMTVYAKNDPAFSGYTDGDSIPTYVDNFSIVLLTKQGDLTPAQYAMYVTDTCKFLIRFKFTIPANRTIPVPKTAGFKYKLDVRFIDYKAIWGMFSPSNKMRDESIIDLSENWKELEFLTRASLPFAEPEVKVYIYTQIAGAMRINKAYIYSVDMQDNKHYAEFDDDHKTTITRDLNNWLPLDSQIGDSTTNMYVDFNKSKEGGRIDNMFKGIPKKLAYSFNVDFNQSLTPQIRVTQNTLVTVDAVCTLPLVFHDSLHLDYTDTIRDVNLSQYSIDSLTEKVEIIDTMKTTDVTLFLTAENTIPLDIKAKLRCLDEKGDTIMDPNDPSKPLLLFEEDMLTFVAPEYAYEGGNWTRKSVGKTVLTAKMTKQKLNMLPKIKNIIYFAELENTSLHDEYETIKGDKQFTAKVTADSGLTIKIGLTAQADIVLNLSK